MIKKRKPLIPSFTKREYHAMLLMAVGCLQADRENRGTKTYKELEKLIDKLLKLAI